MKNLEFDNLGQENQKKPRILGILYKNHQKILNFKQLLHVKK